VTTCEPRQTHLANLTCGLSTQLRICGPSAMLRIFGPSALLRTYGVSAPAGRRGPTGPAWPAQARRPRWGGGFTPTTHAHASARVSDDSHEDPCCLAPVGPTFLAQGDARRALGTDPSLSLAPAGRPCVRGAHGRPYGARFVSYWQPRACYAAPWAVRPAGLVPGERQIHHYVRQAGSLSVGCHGCGVCSRARKRGCRLHRPRRHVGPLARPRVPVSERRPWVSGTAANAAAVAPRRPATPPNTATGHPPRFVSYWQPRACYAAPWAKNVGPPGARQQRSS